MSPDTLVHAYELEPIIVARAIENLSNVQNVVVYTQSAVTFLPVANVIYVNAGATHPPTEWLDALVIGGRLVLPLVPNDRHGCMILITRHSYSAYHRVLKLARTIADLAGSEALVAAHVAEAIQYRKLDRTV